MFLEFLTCSSREPWLLSWVTSCKLVPGQMPRVLTTLIWFMLPMVTMC